MFQDGRLVRVDVEALANTATKSGIRVGDPEAHVHLYPGRIRVEPHPYDEAGTTSCACRRTGRMRTAY